MATVVSRSQQLVTPALNPVAQYSRVVSCVCNPKPAHDPDFSYTPVVGQNVWLLAVHVWFLPEEIQLAAGSQFRILTGTTEPADAVAIFEWDDVVPIFYRGRAGALWHRYYGVNEFS